MTCAEFCVCYGGGNSDILLSFVYVMVVVAMTCAEFCVCYGGGNSDIFC